MKQHPTPPNRANGSAGVVIGTDDKQRLISFIERFLGVDTSELIMVYETLFHHVLKHEGKLSACKKGKQFYDIALRYSCKLKFTPLPFTKSDKIGFPRALKAFRPYLNGSPDARRAALTILQLYKLVESKGDYSTKSITGKYEGLLEPSWLVTFDEVLEELFPKESIEERVNQLRPGLHVSGKKGPNGPSLITSPIDREAIRGTDLEEAICRLAKATKNHYLETLLDESSIDQTDFDYERPTNSRGDHAVHSRIRIKYESGGKARAFCICDYFSQSALSPLHHYLMKWLGRQPNDGTNNHSNAALAVKKWSDGRYGNNVWSFDLTTATDRYPRFLEYRVMKAIFGEEIANDWELVIAAREFVTPDKKLVSFATGQPLGALSSWAAFAVTHHVHIRTAARISGLKPMYRIIGDDITIARDESIAQLYIGMMSDLSVPFSEAKSILPQQMGDYPVCELAKRVFANGIEVTPIPPDAILEGVQSPIGLKNLLEIAILRGYERASRIYPVQSAMPSQAWYPALTFPVRNRLPQLNEVKLFRPIWEDVCEEPPAGLNRGWFHWSSFDENELTYLMKEILLSEVRSGYKKAVRFRNTLYEWSLIGPDFEVEGGDWQPEPWSLHMFMLPRIVDYMTEKLEETIEDIDTAPSIDDPYAYIGGLHSFLDPRQAFLSSDFRDEKMRTKVFISSIIKKVDKVCKSEDPIATLTQMCEYDSLDTEVHRFL